MTVTYSRRVADAGLGTFFHLLLRWKGSIYKLLYRELIIFTVLYYFFSTIYRYRLILLPILFCWFQNEDSSTVSVTRFILKDDQKRLFEKLSIYCDRYAELIPVSFVLGQLVLKYHFFFSIPRNDVHASSPYLKSSPRFLCDLGCVTLVGPVWKRPLARPPGSISWRSC